MNKNTKKIIIISAVCLLIILSGFIIYMTTRIKTYDLMNIENKIESEFAHLNLLPMDKFDTLTDFGFSSEEVSNGMYLKTIIISDEGINVTKNDELNYIIVIQDDKYEEYYDMFYSYIDSNLMSFEENTKEYKLYKNAKLKKIDKKHVVYLVVTKNKSDRSSIISTIEDNLK